MGVIKKAVGFVPYLFTFRRKVFVLRKKYDRTREKADKIRNRERRFAILKVLDQVEPTLVMLEEQPVSRFQRGKMVKYVKAGIEEARKMIKMKYSSSQAVPNVQPSQQKRIVR